MLQGELHSHPCLLPPQLRRCIPGYTMHTLLFLSKEKVPSFLTSKHVHTPSHITSAENTHASQPSAYVSHTLTYIAACTQQYFMTLSTPTTEIHTWNKTHNTYMYLGQAGLHMFAGTLHTSFQLLFLHPLPHYHGHLHSRIEYNISCWYYPPFAHVPSPFFTLFTHSKECSTRFLAGL